MMQTIRTTAKNRPTSVSARLNVTLALSGYHRVAQEKKPATNYGGRLPVTTLLKN